MLILCAVAILLSIADVALTIELLSAGRKGEINPLMRWCAIFRPWLAYLINVGGTAIACWFGLAHRWTLAESRGLFLIAVVLGLRLMSTLQNYRVWRME